MYGLERLIAQLATHPVTAKVEIHVFNRTPFFGSGDVYRSDQPEYLKMNICNREIDTRINEKPYSIVPAPLTFTEWLKTKTGRNTPVNEDGFSSRTRVGSYLEESFAAIEKNLPAQVKLKKFVGEVTGLIKCDNSYQIKWRGKKRDEEYLPYHYLHILLATGHPSRQLTLEEKELLHQTQKKKNTGFVPFVYPTSSRLNSISPGGTVGLKGLGLTFVDAVLALTEGRGGRFMRLTADRFAYHPSGNEPMKIYPFSRSGLPMLSRGPNLPANKIELQFFTQEALHKLKYRKSGEIDFEADLWPLLRQEMIKVYYTVLFKTKDFSLQPGQPLSFSKLMKYVDLFHAQFPEEERFNINAFFNPLVDKNFQHGGEVHEFMVAYIAQANEAARKGPRYSPVAAISQVWKAATPVFDIAFRFGGLTSKSHQKFASHYNGILQRITYGPPIENMEKILALAECGILDFHISSCQQVEFNNQTGGFQLTSAITKASVDVQYLVDARIPKVSFQYSQEGLYANLLKRGTVTLFENKSPLNGDSYFPGCLALDENGQVISEKQEVNPTITATGTPTEGITYDNDTLSPYRNNFVNKWAERVRKILSKEVNNETAY